MAGKREGPLMRGGGGGPSRGSRIATAVAIGITLGCICAFLFTDGLSRFNSPPEGHTSIKSHQAGIATFDAATILPMGGEGSLRPEQCGPACNYRCSAKGHKKRCLFYCNHCCAKCLCVPSGLDGSNKQECPCYNNWKRQDGGPKCP